ncbi:MAG: amylo-alpha-1,6-glucosidase [Planctomycetes bacterium]|nr:amylo-alpha-1,6-glucosidase [Planctomycetota bacterium]
MVRRPTPSLSQEGPEAALGREWLVTNGLGGYASATIAGACTRRYHGLLVAGLPSPFGRYVMLDQLSAEIELQDGQVLPLDRQSLEPEVADLPQGIVAEFRLEAGLPVWEYALSGVRLEKRILMPHLQNTVCIVYRILQAPHALRLRLRPRMHFRPQESVLSEKVPQYHIWSNAERLEVTTESVPPLRMRVSGPREPKFGNDHQLLRVHYGTERARGYDFLGTVWSPGGFQIALSIGEEVAVWASTERWDAFEAFVPAAVQGAEIKRRVHLVERAAPEARTGIGAELVLAADQFIIRPHARPADEAIAEAAGEEARTVIAGYHWFTDWGRDTMISLEGLTLVTGRFDDARQLLQTFSRYVRDGLLPNLFPEGGRSGLYHTADATLWYFHALSRYWQATHDRETLDLLLPVLQDIVQWHIRGTHFGIHVDPADGLLIQGAEGYQLTWMDAKVDDWVVTPRRGKAVEINALWYNALRLLEGWNRETGNEAAAGHLFDQAARVRESFNRRFWNAPGDYLFDIVDGEAGDDALFRPNQIFAVSLEHPVLDSGRWEAVVNKVAAQLLTPVGLRTLAPGQRDYRPTYDGDLRSRDAAYHQGTAWAWLMGPLIDAWCRVYPNQIDKAAELLAGFEPHLGEACVGSISEIFDAESPFHPRGCIAQAWSVAEVLRCWVKTHQAAGS